jgi:hypothetical protein
MKNVVIGLTVITCLAACGPEGSLGADGGSSGGGPGTGGGAGGGASRQGGGSAGGGGAGGGSTCDGDFVTGSTPLSGDDLYVQCNRFPNPTNCRGGKYINFEGSSGRLAACFCYAQCPNGVSEGEVCSASTPSLICTRVRNTTGDSNVPMCLPPGAAWQNLCRG